MTTLTTLIRAALLSICLLTGCKPKEPTPEKLLPNNTLIFIDKSDNKPLSDGIKKDFKIKLRNIVRNNIRSSEDRLAISFIYRDTPRELYKSFVLELKFQQELILQACYKALELPPDSNNGSTSGSDLWSTIAIANSVFADVDPNSIKYVYYFSDMVQNTPIRSFYKTQNLPKDNPAAIKMAKDDLKRIRDQFPELKNNHLKDANITVYQPRAALDNNTASSRLFYYWKTIFEEMGAKYKTE